MTGVRTMADSGGFMMDVINTLRRVPAGRVASYGQIALISGYPRMARQVSWILSRHSREYSLPWHRILNSTGGISLKGENADLQRALLESEGVRFLPSGKVSLRVYQWNPGLDTPIDL